MQRYARIFSMREYLNMTGIAGILQMSPHAVSTLIKRGAFIDADVLVGHPATEEVIAKLKDDKPLGSPDDLAGERPGWNVARVLRYGVEVGRIDDDGVLLLERLKSRPIGRQHTRRRAWWTVEPELLLSVAGVAPMWGTMPGAVRLAVIQGRFIPADVQVGKKTQGWKAERVVEFSRQYGHVRGGKA